jgi:excisionase family DNA binding protein
MLMTEANARLGRAFLTCAQAAERADCSAEAIRRWCDTGILQARKVVGRWRIDPSDLDRLLHGDEPHPSSR